MFLCFYSIVYAPLPLWFVNFLENTFGRNKHTLRELVSRITFSGKNRTIAHVKWLKFFFYGIDFVCELRAVMQINSNMEWPVNGFSSPIV